MKRAAWFVPFIALVALPLAAQQEEDNTAQSQDSTEDSREFGGLRFGAALSVTVDLNSDRVESAEIEVEDEPGLGPTPFVRVTKANNARARIMLESHYFFVRQEKKDSPGREVTPSKFGHGPFVAIQPGSDEIIEAFGAGYMIGWRRPGKKTESFNIAIGAVVDPNVQVLGSGFKENDPAPRDESGDPIPIRYKEEEQYGALLLISFSF